MKRIVVVGGSSGIGKRVAEMYAAEGNMVAVTGRRSELLEAIRLTNHQQIITSCFDVCSQDAMEKMNAIANQMGGIDVVLISAGGGDASESLDYTLDKWMVDVNVAGFTTIANWAFNFFLKQGHGQLAIISSIAAVRGNASAPAYSASKAFQSTYAEGLSIRAAKLKKEIYITCIEPGFVKTAMAKSNKLFWVTPLDKAAKQIIHSIDRRKRKVYISRRWRLIALLLKHLPYGIFRRIV